MWIASAMHGTLEDKIKGLIKAGYVYTTAELAKQAAAVKPDGACVW